MVVLKNLSERIKFLKTKEGIITFKAGEEKEVDSKLINLKNLPNNLVIKNDQEAEVKEEREEAEKIEEPEETKEEGSTEEPEKEPEQEIEEDSKTIIEKEIESLRVKLESVNGKRQKEAINNKIIELEAKLKELN